MKKIITESKDLILEQRISLDMLILILLNLIICILNMFLWDSEYIRGFVLGVDLPIMVLYFVILKHNKKELKKLMKEIEEWEKKNK